MNEFIAVDVETANENYWSICQVGLAFFSDGKLIDTWSSYVNPETYFLDFNIGIHGITEHQVISAPCLAEAYELVAGKVGDGIIAHHMPFDRLAFCRCAERTSKDLLACRWVDTARIARHTWREVSQRGYGLADLANRFNIQFQHHNALEDAKAAGLVLVRAAHEAGEPFDDWISQYFERSDHQGSSHQNASEKDFQKLAAAEPDPAGPLYGEVVVFTGELSISRMEAAQAAYRMGCNIDTGVTRKTTLLVIGTQDISKLAGYEKSSKQRKAEDLRLQGYPIRFIGEDDFFAMINY